MPPTTSWDMPELRNTVLFAGVIWGMYLMMDLLQPPENGIVLTGWLLILSLQRSKTQTRKFSDIHNNTVSKPVLHGLSR
jgi:hypothetical protein